MAEKNNKIKYSKIKIERKNWESSFNLTEIHVYAYRRRHAVAGENESAETEAQLRHRIIIVSTLSILYKFPLSHKKTFRAGNVSRRNFYFSTLHAHASSAFPRIEFGPG